MKKYIISLDQGTTSCRSILFDRNKKILHTEQKEFSQIMPENGWVEHDPIEILETQLFTLKRLLKSRALKLMKLKVLVLLIKEKQPYFGINPRGNLFIML